MSFEDEVRLFPRFLRERQVDLYEGSTSSTRTHEAGKCRCESTQEEKRVFANQIGR